MTGWVILILGLGIFLSALFSGSETGFYRVTRVRLVLDGLGGDHVSRMLLRLTNHPALFVATTLIGNNVANYMTSLGIVLATHLVVRESHFAETMAPTLLSPLVFVYCELLPKQLFFYSPNRLLRRCGPVLLFFTILFAPIALCLWLLGWLIERLVGQTPLRVRLALANKELQQVFKEGEQAGILHTTQRDIAQKMFDHSTDTVSRHMTPLNRVVSVPLGAPTRDAMHVAHTQKSPVVPVCQSQGRELIGYVRVIDLKLAGAERVETVRPLPRLSRGESFLRALVRLHNDQADAALIENRSGTPIGLLYTRSLATTLFEEV